MRRNINTISIQMSCYWSCRQSIDPIKITNERIEWPGWQLNLIFPLSLDSRWIETETRKKMIRPTKTWQRKKNIHIQRKNEKKLRWMTIGVKTMSNDTIGWTHTCNRYKQNVYVSNEPEKNRILFTPIQFFRIIDERWVNSFISGSIHLLFTMLLNSFFFCSIDWMSYELWNGNIDV